MNILGIVPARAGSKRLPNKNKLPLAGKPLVAYAIEAGLGCRLLDTLVVSSDDPDILAIARQYTDPRLISLKRPEALAADHSPAIDYVRHTLQYLKAERQYQPDIVVILQPSSPLTLPEDIEGTVRLLIDSGADSAVSVVKLDHAIHPVKLKVMEGDKLLPYWEPEEGRMAEHELPAVYVRNGAVYTASKSIIKKGEIVGKDCRGYLMPMERSVDINRKIDFLFVDYLINRI
jgi:CMP-N,N'-diacetyllegionaminic acid synthase